MHWLQGTGTLNGRTDTLLISLPNIALLLGCLLAELLVRCSNCSILDVTEAEEEGRNWRRVPVSPRGREPPLFCTRRERAAMLAEVLFLCRGARNHSGSWCSIDNRINVASTQALLHHPGNLPSSLHSICQNPILRHQSQSHF